MIGTMGAPMNPISLPANDLILFAHIVAAGSFTRAADRTGLPLTAIEKPLQQAEAKGLITRDWQRIAPTTRGLDFLSELQGLFLPEGE